MEERILKKIKTSCPLPLYIYTTQVNYNEVRKASGVAYIVLKLIKNNTFSMEKISTLLLKFGIPLDMHYIFGKEIANLLGTEILQSQYQSAHFMTPKYFVEILISDIKITVKGQKLFLEGAIPTGVEKTKVKEIFFSPITRKFNVQSSEACMPFSSSYLGEEFLDVVDIDISGMEDYINANITKIGLKAEERMISFVAEEPRKMQVRKEEGLTIIVKASGVEFSFDTTDETAFFNKYFSSKLMTQGMLLKNKYKFVNSFNEIVSVPTVDITELTEVSNIYIPSDAQKQASRPCKIFLNKGKLGISREDNVITFDKSISTALLDLMDEKTEFALLDSSSIRCYSALNVTMPCEKFGDIFELQLLAERIANNEKCEKVIVKIFDIFNNKPFDEEAGKVILFIADLLKDNKYFYKYTVNKLNGCKSTDEKLELLMKLNFAFGKNTQWRDCFESLARNLFEQSVVEVKLDNMIYKNTVLSPIKEALNIPSIEYISKFSRGVKETEDAELVYQALEAAGFAINDILNVVNVAENYARSVLINERILSDTELAGKYKTFALNLWKLNAMLGIENYENYTLKESFNTDSFFDVYVTMQSAYKNIEKFKSYASKEYDTIKKYFNIYEPVHELLSIERTASSHPNKITVKYIDENIARGKYKEAICDLLVKLQFDLRLVLKQDALAQANELIDKAADKKMITLLQKDELHKLRMCRNSFQHPERKQVAFDKKIIEGWRDIVFSVGEDKL